MEDHDMLLLSRLLTVGLLLITALSCENTRLVTSWKDPGTSQLNFHKVLVLVLTRDESVRRAGEDTLCSAITRAQCVPSYTIFPSADLRAQEATANATVKELGFDGAVVMRVVDKAQQTSWVPGGYPGPYSSFYGYWGYGYGVAYSPGYLATATLVRMETNIYSVVQDQLVWSGMSDTFNPTGPRDVMLGIIRVVGEQLRKEGMIQ
jgi:hypothetical protein